MNDPTSHHPYSADAHLEVARRMLAAGATVAELADHFGVSIASVELWAVIHEDFAAVLGVAKERADDRVERALYTRSVGYTHDSEKIFISNGEVVRVSTRQHVPPEVGAAFLWLKNRRPELWRDKREEDHSGAVTVTIRRVKSDGA